jgi:hypothetical protein
MRALSPRPSSFGGECGREVKRKHSALICRWWKDDTNSSNPHDDPVGGGHNCLRMYDFVHVLPVAATVAIAR